MMQSTKVLVIIGVILVSTISAIVGVGLVSNFNHSKPKTSSSPILTINSLRLSPGLTQDPSAFLGPYADTHYNFSYTIHAEVTINFKEPMKTYYTGIDPCSIGLIINSSAWYSYPIIYHCPAFLSSPTLTMKAGTYNTSIIAEIISNTSIPVFPSTVTVVAQSGFFNATSKPVTLRLTINGLQYMFLYDITVTPSETLANGSKSYFVNATFYYESDSAITISNYSKFSLIVNTTTGTGGIFPNSIDLWSFKTVSSTPSNNVTFGPGGMIFNISTTIFSPNGSKYFDVNNLPNHLPLQVVYNQGTALSNSYDLGYFLFSKS